jgi:GTP-binding protein
MEKYFDGSRDLALVVQLVDMRHSPTKDDITMLKFLEDSNIPFIIALTKSDKLNKTEREKRLSALKEELSFLNDYKAIPFSATKGEGTEEIRSEIEKALQN